MHAAIVMLDSTCNIVNQLEKGKVVHEYGYHDLDMIPCKLNTNPGCKFGVCPATGREIKMKRYGSLLLCALGNTATLNICKLDSLCDSPCYEHDEVDL